MLLHDQGIYRGLLEARARGEKRLAVLIDPDKTGPDRLEKTVDLAARHGVSYFFIGGSLLVGGRLDAVLTDIRRRCDIPLVLFPGSSFQLSYRADALLFLSLISGRNPELLIGQHVMAAPFLRLSPLEIISTGYLLVDGGVQTAVQYMSNTVPIPAHKEDIAAATALAGALLGLKMMYLEAGSGARWPVPVPMIEAVRAVLDGIPLIVGGGIRTPEAVAAAFGAGADVVVVGTAVEEDPGLIAGLRAFLNFP